MDSPERVESVSVQAAERVLAGERVGLGHGQGRGVLVDRQQIEVPYPVALNVDRGRGPARVGAAIENHHVPGWLLGRRDIERARGLAIRFVAKPEQAVGPTQRIWAGGHQRVRAVVTKPWTADPFALLRGQRNQRELIFGRQLQLLDCRRG